MKVRVTVSLRPGVLDAQGKAVEAALSTIGFAGVSGVRVGKVIEFEVATSDPEQARREGHLMAEKLLANPVIESWNVDVLAA